METDNYTAYTKDILDALSAYYGIPENSLMEPIDSDGCISAEKISQHAVEMKRLSEIAAIDYQRRLDAYRYGCSPKIEVIKNDLLDEKSYRQFRFPKSKKKRIKKKWANKESNWKFYIVSKCVWEGSKLYAGSLVFERIKDSFSNKMPESEFKPLATIYRGWL